MAEQFSFCESVVAGPLSRWHIRRLTAQGKKLGGGIDTPSLCARLLPSGLEGGGGWDLDVEITEHHLGHCCVFCVATYRELVGGTPATREQSGGNEVLTPTGRRLV